MCVSSPSACISGQCPHGLPNQSACMLSRCLSHPHYVGKASAFNDLFELDTQDPEEYKWRELQAANPPPPRARHAAIAVSTAWFCLWGCFYPPGLR